MSDKRDLTSGPIWLNLVRLAGPMLFGIAAVMSVQLVDTYFVGRLGTGPLAALSFSFPVRSRWPACRLDCRRARRRWLRAPSVAVMAGAPGDWPPIR